MRALGRRIRRLEDLRLITGRGRYTDDLRLPAMLHATLVRSPVAHGLLHGIDAEDALAQAGVHGLLTAADLGALGVGELRVNWLQPDQRNASNPVLATDRVRYVGQPVAVVVADSPYVAEDAADLVVLDIDELPAVVGTEDALQPDAPLLYPAWGTNVVAETVVEAGDIEACFSAAPVRVSGRFRVQRQAAMPMEPRASLADYDSATDEVVLWTSTMTPHLVRTMIATTCGWPEHKLRVVAPGRRRQLRPQGSRLSRGRPRLRSRAALRSAGEVDRGPAGALPRDVPCPGAGLAGRACGRRDWARSRCPRPHPLRQRRPLLEPRHRAGQALGRDDARPLRHP